MIALTVIWLLQDFFQVFTMGILMAPNVFLMSVIFLSLRPRGDNEKYGAFIWAAFIGGLIWDLRWTNLPGLTAAVNSAVTAMACIIWRKLPVQGRSVALFTVMITVSMVATGLAHSLFWTMPSQAALRQLAVQQLAGVPAVVLISIIYWRVSDRHV